jgi:hypothetical protein
MHAKVRQAHLRMGGTRLFGALHTNLPRQEDRTTIEASVIHVPEARVRLMEVVWLHGAEDPLPDMTPSVQLGRVPAVHAALASHHSAGSGEPIRAHLLMIALTAIRPEVQRSCERVLQMDLALRMESLYRQNCLHFPRQLIDGFSCPVQSV